MDGGDSSNCAASYKVSFKILENLQTLGSQPFCVALRVRLTRYRMFVDF
jgi:hypothetical protein